MKASDIPLPENWPSLVRSAMLHITSLAQYGIIYTRSWCGNSKISRVRLAAKLEWAQNEITLVQEQLNLLRSRFTRVSPRCRPYYTATERMRILELRAARAWNIMQTAEHFLVEPETVSSWMKRIDEHGPAALVQIKEPINKFPQYVRHITQRLKILCPTMGKKRIAEVLTAASLYLAATTAGRFLNKQTSDPPDPLVSSDKPHESEDATQTPVVTAKYPNHVWHMDLTVVPTHSGFWTSWIPFSLPQRYPFCYWIAVIIDHFSRRIMTMALFLKEPSAHEIKMFLSRTIRSVRQNPKYLISDQGPQLKADSLAQYCKRKHIKHRFGAIGQHGSIAVIERFIRSLKDECTRRICIPLRAEDMVWELNLYVEWFNTYRPHLWLDGLTPHQRYHGLSRGPPISEAEIKNVRLDLQVSYLEGRHHLPIVQLKKAA